MVENSCGDASRAISGGAFWGALGVALGAFGAHLLPTMIERSPEALDAALTTWKTAAHYHLLHALALILWGRCRAATQVEGAALNTCLASGVCLASGSVIFSGSLYALVLTDVKWLGAITPIGGALMIAGWLMWAWSAWPPHVRKREV